MVSPKVIGGLATIGVVGIAGFYWYKSLKPQIALVAPDGTLKLSATYYPPEDVSLSVKVPPLSKPMTIDVYVDKALFKSYPWDTMTDTTTVDLGPSQVGYEGSHPTYAIITMEDGTKEQSNTVTIIVGTKGGGGGGGTEQITPSTITLR